MQKNFVLGYPDDLFNPERTRLRLHSIISRLARIARSGRDSGLWAGQDSDLCGSCDLVATAGCLVAL